MLSVRAVRLVAYLKRRKKGISKGDNNGVWS